MDTDYQGIIKASVSTPCDELKNDILVGLTKPNKALPSKYLYDKHGSDLFNKITRHPDYYLTGCEFEILTTYCSNILDIIGEGDFNLVELGPGEGIKTSVLINYFLKKKIDFSYMPIDISESYLCNFRKKILQEHPCLRITPIQGDYVCGLSWLRQHEKRRNIVLFLGSSIGNFDLIGAEHFLLTLRRSLKKGDLLLIGFDLKKSISILLKAYDDTEGLTRSFNLNLLHRINQELTGEFDLNSFYHHATYNVYTGAMESYLISLISQTVPIQALQRSIHFEAFEAIHIEYSYKYLVSQIRDLAKNTGFNIAAQFQDSRKYFVDSFWEVL